MGLYRFKPTPSGRMGILWTLATIKDAAVVEFGCMGHMLYSTVTLSHAGVYEGCKMYSTHIDETDIALGSTLRLNKTIENILQHQPVKVIFLLPSAVPEVIGTDLKALALELGDLYPEIKFIPLAFGGFDIYQHRGVEETLKTIVDKIPLDRDQTQKYRYNIIGSCADLFRFQSDAHEIKRILKGALNMEPICILSSETAIDAIENMGKAQINLVIRKEGEAAAKVLQKRFGTPYLLERPYGIAGTEEWLDKIIKMIEIDENRDFIQAEKDLAYKQIYPIMPAMRHLVRMHTDEATLTLGGHLDTVKGILKYGMEEFDLKKGACWCDNPESKDLEIPYYKESEWIEIIQAHQKGILMASGEALAWKGANLEYQIANPDIKWRLHEYDPPFVGFRGAVHLANLWINSTNED